MKTMKKVLLTAMMVMVSTFAIANDNEPSVKVEKAGVKSVVVFAQGLGGYKTQVQLKDKKGSMIYGAYTQKEQKFVKKFDLSSLKAGQYTLEVENESILTTTPVVLNTDSVWIVSADQVTIIKPVIRKNGEKLDVIIPDNNRDVLITIYDSNFRKLASESVNGEPVKRFDLSQLVQGAYTVKIRTRGRNFVQSVSIK